MKKLVFLREILKDIVSRCELGIIVFIVSSAILITNSLEFYKNILGRRSGVWWSIFSSYFIHANWSHLCYNFICYVAVVVLLYLNICLCLEDKDILLVKIFLDNKWWLCFQLILMIAVGSFDLTFNKIYSRVPGIGMSDFVLALYMILLYVVYLVMLQLSLHKTNKSKEKLAFIVSILTFLLATYILSAASNFVLLKSGINVGAHLIGIYVSFIVSVIVTLVDFYRIRRINIKSSLVLLLLALTMAIIFEFSRFSLLAS